MTRLLDLGCEWLGLSVGYMTRIEDAVQTVDSAVGDQTDIQPGETAPLSETYCQHTLASDAEAPVHSIENAADAGLLDSDEYERFGLSCYVGGTITVNGEDYGTVCFADTEPRDRPFASREQTFVDLLTQWVGLSIERHQQASRLTEEHELTTGILASSPTSILVFDDDGTITLANDRAGAVLGDDLTLEGTRGIPTTLYDVAMERVPDAEMPHRRVADGESLTNVEYRLDDGTCLSVSGRPLYAGHRGTVVLTVADVTEQRHQTDAMRALSDTLASATGSFDDQLSDLLEVGRTHLGLANGHLTEIGGDRHEIVVSEGLPEVISSGTVSDLDSTFCAAVVERDGMCTIVEASTELTDTTPYDQWGLETYVGTPITVEGKMYGTLCFVDESPRRREFSQWEQTFVETLGRCVETQIEQRHNAEERDRDRALLEGVFNSQRTQVGIADTEGRLIDANEAAVEFIDADSEALVGTQVWETPWFGGEDAAQKCRAGVDCAADGEMTDFEIQYDPDDGERAVFSVNVRPVFEGDEVINVVVEGYDVTALRERERELERRQQHIDAILNNAPIVLFGIDEEGEFRHSRGQGLASFGLKDGELVGESIYEEYGAFPEVIDDYERARDGEAVESVRTIGETVFRSWYRPVEMDDGTRVTGITIDITEQQRQKERVASVHAAAEDIMYARTPEAVSETLVDIVGDLISYPLAAVWMPEEGSDSLAPVAATEETLDIMDAPTAEAALPAIEPGSFEMSVFEAGETRVVENYNDTGAEMGRGTPIQTVVMVPLGDHGVLHVGSPTVQPPSETELDLIGILARNAEAALVSTTREVELEAYKDELERSNKALQEFAYIASHDLQEPLRMVSSYVDLLQREYGDEFDEEATEYMEFAVGGARRMQNMINALLEYSRVATRGGAFERTDTEAILRKTLDALQLRINETDATVSVGSLPSVQADPDQLGQVFQNLLENAIEYAHADGTDPQIEVSAARTDDTVTVTVADNGPGIPEGMDDDVFEIFTRGDRNGTEGTGIGLAVCKRIVERHDGDIWVEASASSGATFRFTLPAAEGVADDE
ncbi:hypothetical protein BRC96_02290 [Halobacteriales archaeon QS_6_64_34]|nr:MAG: hypothetical protein BRC96_02290 [Halobacteriales archaeon QS_6_64_34]